MSEAVAEIISQSQANLLTETEFAQAVGVHVNTIRRLRRAAKITYRKIGRKYLYLQEDIADYWNRMKVSPK